MFPASFLSVLTLLCLANCVQCRELELQRSKRALKKPRLTAVQAALVKCSWRIIENNNYSSRTVQMLVNFYGVYPSIKARFSQIADVPHELLLNNTYVAGRASRFFRRFSEWIHFIDNPCYLNKKVGFLAKIAKWVGVEAEAFQTLFHTISDYMVSFGADEDAWKAAIDTIEEVFMRYYNEPKVILTADQVKSVKATWNIAMEPDQLGHGVKMLVKYFGTYPKNQIYFRKFANVTLALLANNTDVAEQADHMFRGLGGLIKYLDNPCFFYKQVAAFAKLHQRKGVGLSQFEQLFCTVLDYMVSLGGNKIAWTVAINTIEEALDKSLRKRKVTLTADQAESVKDTWKLIEANLSSHGVNMLVNYFGTYPENQAKYRKFANVSHDLLSNNSDVVDQANQVFSGFGDGIKIVDRPCILYKQIASCAKAHRRIGVGLQQFRQLFCTILDYMVSFGGNKTAWTAALDTIEEAYARSFKKPKERMTPDQAASVKETWKIIEADISRHGVNILVNYFCTFPKNQAKFKKFANVPCELLANNTDVAEQADHMFRYFGEWIKFVDSPCYLNKSVAFIADMHKRKGVGIREFRQLFCVINEYMVTNVDGDRDAWTAAFDTIEEVFVRCKNPGGIAELNTVR